MVKKILSNVNFLFPPLKEEQWDIFQKLISDLSVSQMIWVSGYLYSLVVNHNDSLDSCDSSDVVLKTRRINNIQNFHKNNDSISCPVITILSASQTGNSRGLAKKLYQSLIDEGFNVCLFDVVNYNFRKINQEKLLFLIISTYGEGEPPEEAVMFYKHLFSKNAPSMEGVYFSVFGLGDRSYRNFSKASKDFDCRLEELGACRLYQRVDADIDYDQDASNWRKEVICLLKKKFMIFHVKNTVISRDKVTGVDNDVGFIKNTYTKENPFVAHILVCQKITSRNSIKDVYHLEIDLSGSGLCYQPGDSLGVWYENDPNLVIELLKYCSFTGQEEVVFNDQLLSFSIVLQKYYELTHNTPLIVRKYATLINNSELLSLSKNEDYLQQFVSSISIIDMIRYWAPKKLLPEQFLSVLRPLTPRFYSISSSQKEVGEEVHITVGVVRYKVDGYIRTGGASGYLIDRLSDGNELRVFVVSNRSFRLPADSNISIIMIAAGTGIAPFRAFMQQRGFDKALGKNWLFFGNLCFLDDFLYQREWQQYVKNGLLTNINTAWSRDQKNKIYVQDKILQNGFEVWDWIKNGAYVYVCGDACNMARDVEEVLIQLGIKHGKMSVKESDEFFGNMCINHRYQKDVY